MQGSINSLETFGLVDGPGIRVVVFLNGCSLRCKFCHNPEMWKKAENNTTVDELVNKIKRYKPYFKNTGGVTFSGGEPLLQSKFLLEVCKKLKKENIHIALDTAGVGYDYDELLDYVDLVIFDIKAIDKDKYHELVKHDIKDSLVFLDKCQKQNIPMWIRQVIVPGINDTEEYVLELKEFISKISTKFKEVILLTGDNDIIANNIANEVGIKKVISNVKPEGKGDVIKKLKEEGKTVLMVGDGVNDSLALTYSDVGIGLAKGSDVALASSDFILMNSDLIDILDIIEVSKLIRKNIAFNLLWAFIYNTLFYTCT